MTQDTNSTILTRRIGNTTYKVRAFFKENESETMEDKILRLIQREGLALPQNCGKINVTQMNRQSERSA